MDDLGKILKQVRKAEPLQNAYVAVNSALITYHTDIQYGIATRSMIKIYAEDVVVMILFSNEDPHFIVDHRDWTYDLTHPSNFMSNDKIVEYMMCLIGESTTQIYITLEDMFHEGYRRIWEEKFAYA